MSTLVPITPPPGIVANGTEYSRKGRWIDSDLIRWTEGIARPIGGWERFIATSMNGIPIRMFAYSRNNSVPALVIGTTTNVYCYDGTLTDITPAGFVTPYSNGNTGFGWGAYQYGKETYGTERSNTGLYPPVYHYFFDAWGDTLVFSCNSDGKIYRYGDGDSVGVEITDAPNNNAGIIVTDERFVMALGAGNQYNRIEWSDRENYDVWTPASTNLSGGLNINSNSKILDAVKWRGNVLLFTGSDVHLVRYLGAPLVYGVSKISDCATPVSPRCTVASGVAVTWVSDGGIMQYDGSLRPVECPVWEFYKDNVNSAAIGAVYGGHNSFNNEIIWFFPSGESLSPDKYILWNYKEGLWSVGYMGRSAWVDKGAFEYPMSITNDGVILRHESTTLNLSYGIGTYSPYLESAPMDVAYGNGVITVDRLIPDNKMVNNADFSYTLVGKNWPSTTDTVYGPYKITDDSGKIDIRATARQFKIRIDCPTDKDFSIGEIRSEVKERGRR